MTERSNFFLPAIRVSLLSSGLCPSGNKLIQTPQNTPQPSLIGCSLYISGNKCNAKDSLLFFLKKKRFLSDTFTCPILGPLVPLFWISGYVFSGFQSQSGFCLIHIAEANVMYIPWDPPLVLHIADLLMDSIAGYWPGSYLAQGYYCVAAVSLEPAINRSWVQHTKKSATRPGKIPFYFWDIWYNQVC